jgi:hypothetical protein
MVIGYDFRDSILERGMDHGLKLLIIDPKGAYAGDSLEWCAVRRHRPQSDEYSAEANG